MKPVEVIWTDIEYRGGWNSQKKMDKFITEAKNRTVHQVGFLYEDDEEQIVLVDSIAGDEFGTIHVIPRWCIKSIREL